MSRGEARAEGRPSRGPLLALLAAALGCGDGRPEQSLRWREQWELIGALEDGSIVDARVSVANTGLLRGQGHLRLERWSPRETAIVTGVDAPPGVVALDPERRALTMGRDGLRAVEGGAWRYELQSADMGATLTLAPELDALPPLTVLEGGGQWAIEALVPAGELSGWLESGKQGGLQRGRGVLIHRGGDGRPAGERAAAYVLGPGLSIGLDEQGGLRLAWAALDGHRMNAADARLSWEEGGGAATLDLRPGADLWVRLAPRPPEGSRDPHEHLLSAERALLRWAAPTPPRRLQRALAEVHLGDEVRKVPALLLRGGD